MNNLPITINAPQPDAKPAQATPATKPMQAAPTQATPTPKPAQAGKLAQDSAPQSRSFGDVLARQVSDAATDEDTAQPKKISAKSADEIFSSIKAKTDNASIPALPNDATANLPPDMLATLIPLSSPTTPQSAASAQGVSTIQGALTATSSDAAGATKRSVSSATSAKDIPDTDPLGANQNTSATHNAALTRGTPQLEAKKDPAFSNMMETLTASTAIKLSNNDDKAAALAVAPQPNTSAQAAMQAATAAVPPSSVMPAQVVINTPVTHEQWGDEFNQKITWLSNQKEQTAELHLNPPQLGPMDVVLKISGDQATAFFTSPHAAVREAVEQALPRLREMMADNGIMLGNATVSDQAPRNRENNQDNRSSGSRSSIGGIADSTAPSNLNVRVSPISQHNGIVDTFA